MFTDSITCYGSPVTFSARLHTADALCIVGTSAWFQAYNQEPKT